MTKNIRLFFVLILLLSPFCSQKLLAQDFSLLPEVSLPYLDKLISTAKANYPRLKVHQTRIDIAKTAITRSKLSWFEGITVSYVYQPQNFTFDYANPERSYFNGFQAGVFLNIGSLLQKPALIKQSKLELQAATGERDEYLLTITTEVKKRYYNYLQRIAEMKLQTKMVHDSESSVADIRGKFQKGEENYDNYNKAQMTLSEHQSSKILAEANLFIAKAELEELLGQSLESVK